MSEQTTPGHAPHSLRMASSAAWIILLGIFLFATFRGTLVAVSDWYFRIGTLPAIARAVRYMPSNARYHYYDALATEQNSPASGEIAKQFAEAVRLEPRFSDAMLSWSVEKELGGDRGGAERLLLDAAKIDHLLRPSWAMANFYYRTGNTAKFWPAALDCFRLMARTGVMEGRFALIPVFNLCWSMSQDAAAILTRAIPDDRTIRAYYLGYLLNTNRIEPAKQVAALIAPQIQASDATFLIAYCNSLIARGDIAPALEAWNAMANRKAIPFAPLDFSRNALITDADFSAPPTGNGFDWHARFPDQAHFSFSQGAPGYHFSFDGAEPEQFDLLTQVVPVSPRRSYRLSIKAQSGMDATASGLRWSVTDLTTGAVLPSVPIAAGLQFTTPAATRAITLRLAYQRQPGTTMLKGDYGLQSVTLSVL